MGTSACLPERVRANARLLRVFDSLMLLDFAFEILTASRADGVGVASSSLP
jgi:hypothetical protein